MISTLAVEGYRSLRRLVVSLERLNVVTGANGSGKSSLYRALRLLADSSRNGAVAALAREGGLESTLWAGPETIGRGVREGRYPVQGTTRSGPVSLRLGFAGYETHPDIGPEVVNGPRGARSTSADGGRAASRRGGSKGLGGPGSGRGRGASGSTGVSRARGEVVKGSGGVQGSHHEAAQFGYAVDLGLPIPADSLFDHDPEIKVEATWSGPVLRPASVLAERRGGMVRFREANGGWYGVPHAVPAYDSMLSEVADPQRAPELLLLRERIRSWRFYDHLRTDAAAPARAAQVGTRTPVLGHDGADLAAAIQTISEIGDGEALAAAVDNAFPGSRVEIRGGDDGRMELLLRQHGLLRALSAAELSDGTLRYLLWVAALLTPRPPELLVLNEPETSLHPDLLEPLAELIGTAAEHTQIVAVTHAKPLVEALEKRAAQKIELVKEYGETTVAGRGNLDEPLWYWPKR